MEKLLLRLIIVLMVTALGTVDARGGDDRYDFEVDGICYLIVEGGVDVTFRPGEQGEY